MHLLLSFLLTVAAPAEPLAAHLDRNYYTTEAQALLRVDRPLEGGGVVEVRRADRLLASGPLGAAPLALALADLPKGDNALDVILRRDGQEAGRLALTLRRLEPRANEVKIDLQSGGLIVAGRPFFPFGFYCYTTGEKPQPALALEEAINGFNLMSPYQPLAAAQRANRLAYLDDCARAGMKVHYQLKSPILGVEDPAKREAVLRLIEEEVLAVRDHPALLAWYIADEPEGNKQSPGPLREVHDLIARLDPYHPVTIVLMSAKPAETYADAMDLIMADPYPIPAGDPNRAGTVPAQLVAPFRHRKPVWIVPQAFGGNEWWRREPTAREVRLMTWRAVQEGATGIQYFIRNGLNGFPKSTAMWAEAAAVAKEVAELTPDLLSDEPRPTATATPEPVKAAAWRHDGLVTVVLANVSKQPSTCQVTVDGVGYSGKARAVFEDREVEVKQGQITDLIDGYGTRVYQFQTAPPAPRPGAPTVAAGNVLFDPGFEEMAQAGVPDCCYVNIGGGHGASYFLDSTTAVEGRHSLRIHVPDTTNIFNLDPYQQRMKAGVWELRVWARGEPLPALGDQPAQPASMQLRLGGYTDPVSGEGPVAKRVTLTRDWQLYTLTGRCPDRAKSAVGVRVDSPGTVWIDLLQLVPAGG